MLLGSNTQVALLGGSTLSVLRLLSWPKPCTGCRTGEKPRSKVNTADEPHKLWAMAGTEPENRRV